MADLKVGIQADGDSLLKTLDDIASKINDVSRASASTSGKKFDPVDVKGLKDANKELSTYIRQQEQLFKVSKTLRDARKNSGQDGKSIHELDFDAMAPNAKAAQRMRNQAFGYATRGTSFDQGQFSGGSGYRRNGGWGGGRGVFQQSVEGFTNGVNGGIGRIVQGGFSGASEGEKEGGFGGGAMGLLKGVGIAALVLGAVKAGQAVGEGYDMAKERSNGLDTLKRQLGDLGVSFNGLKAVTDAASEGLGVNSKEFTQLAISYSKLSRNSEDKNAEILGGNVRDATRFSRAYGLDPSQGANFFGSMKNLDPKQNNRELALQIAESIEKSGGRAMAPDVMQFVQSMASTVSRMTLGSANTGAISAAFGSMVGRGMTSENAGSILGQANNSISQMGSAGEAGQNFIMSSLGAKNPILAKALAAGGLFGTKNSVFGAGTELSKYLGASGAGLAGGADGNRTNWEAIKSNLMKSYSDPYLRLDGTQRLLGLSSPEQAAAMLNLDGKQSSGLSKSLALAGVDVSKLNAGGIATMAKIGGATTHEQLDGIYSDIGKRTGKDSLSDKERADLDKAQKGGTEDFRKLLAQTMAAKDQQSTDAKDMLAGIKDVETAQTKVGDKLIAPMNVMRDALLKMAGGTANSLHQAAIDAEKSEISDQYDSKISQKQKQRKEILAKYAQDHGGLAYGNLSSMSELEKLTSPIDSEIKALSEQKQNKINQVDARDYDVGSGMVGSISGWGDDLLKAQIMAESGGKHRDANGNLITSKAGAKGIAQIMPGTAKSPGFGITPLKDDSVEESLRLQREYMGALYGRYVNTSKALGAYNWGLGNVDKAVKNYGDDWLSHAPKETQTYVKKITSASNWSSSGADVVHVIVTQQTVDKNGNIIKHENTPIIAVPKGSGTKTVTL